MQNRPVFSIVLPVMNQEDHIERVIRSFYTALVRQGFLFELIAVVNGSTDKSYEICKRISKELPNVSVIDLKKSGYGLAVIWGFKKARGKYYCYLNSARTYPDELINCLKYFLINPNVIIHGVRKKRDTKLRQLTSWIFSLACRLLTGVSSHDINGIPKIFSKENYIKLNLGYKNSMIDLELLDKAMNYGIPVIAIPVYKNIRHGGRSTSNFLTSFRLVKEIIIYVLKK